VGTVDADGLTGTPLTRELERRLVDVEHEDRRRRERTQALDANVPEAAGADHDARAPRMHQSARQPAGMSVDHP
jgi:hypothetical protein